MKNNIPLLSVILPAYNVEKYIGQCIDSILAQTFVDFELIIADDGSTDNTKKIIDTYKDKRIIVSHNNENIGKVGTVNRLYTLVKGDYITIHDSDDYSHLDRFQQQILLLSCGEYALCGTSFYNMDEYGVLTGEQHMSTNYEDIKQNFLEKSMFHGPTMMFRSDIIESIGGIYRYFRNKEDVDLAVRISEKYKSKNLDKCLYYYRNHPEALSKSGYNFLKFEGMKLISILANERRIDGEDSLMIKNDERFKDHLFKLEEPYLLDKGLLFRKSASHNMYFHFYRNAIMQSFKGIIADPFQWINYKTFLYCIKVSLYTLFKTND